MDVPPQSSEHGPPWDLDADGQTEAEAVVEEVAPKTAFNFSDLGSGNTEEVILCDRIPIAAWSSLAVSIRVHAYNAPGARVFILARGVAPSEEDGADFVTGDVAVVLLTGTAPTLQQLAVALSSVQTPFLRIVMSVVGTTAALSYFELSCDVVGRAG